MASYVDSSAQGSASSSEGIFNPLLKIKEEDTAIDDEIYVQESMRKWQHILKPMMIKMEPLDEQLRLKDNTAQQSTIMNKRLSRKNMLETGAANVSTEKIVSPSKKQILSGTSSKSKPNKTSTASSMEYIVGKKRQKRMNLEPVFGKSKGGKNLVQSSTLSQASATNKRSHTFVPSHTISKEGGLSKRDPEKPDGSGMWQKHASKASGGLSPDDLRHFIDTRKGTENTVVIGQFSASSSDVPESELLDMDDDFGDNFDSMSIHADDDDLLDNEKDVDEDLNALGKHLPAVGKKHTTPEKRPKSSNLGKRKHSEKEVENNRNKKKRSAGSPMPVGRSKSLNDFEKEKGSEKGKEKVSGKGKEKESMTEVERKRGDGACYDIDDNNTTTGTPLGRSCSETGLRSVSNVSRQDEGATQNMKDTGHFSNRLPENIRNTKIQKHQDNNRREYENRYRKHQQRINQQRNCGEYFGPRPSYEGGPRMNIVRPNMASQNAGFLPLRIVVPNLLNARPDGLIPNLANFMGRPPFVGRPMMNQDLPRNQFFRRQFPMQQLQAGVDGKRSALSGATDQRHHHLLSVLIDCCNTKNFELCIVTCKEIIDRYGKVEIHLLQDLLLTAAEGATNNGAKNLDSRVVLFILSQIRIERGQEGLIFFDFTYAIEALIVLDDTNSAMSLVLEMKEKHLKPRRNDLVHIRNAIFASSSAYNVDSLIKFCDELEEHDLIGKRIVEEILKHVSAEELKQKTKSKQLLQILGEIDIPDKVVQSPVLQPVTPTFEADSDVLIQTIEQISPQENIPADLLIKLIKSIKTENAFFITAKLSSLPEEVLSSVDKSVWNDFLKKACSGPLAHLQLASQIQSIMANNQIAVESRLSLELVCSFQEAGMSKEAVQHIKQVDLEELSDDDVTDRVYDCLISLMGQNGIGSVEDDYEIAMIVIGSKRIPSEEKLRGLINALEKSSRHREILHLINELQDAGLKPSWETCASALSALETWDDNPEAFIGLYRTVKQYYPGSRIFNGAPTFKNVPGPSTSCNGTPMTNLVRESTSSSVRDQEDLPVFENRTVSDVDRHEFLHTGPPLPLKSPFEDLMEMEKRSQLATVQPIIIPESVIDHLSTNREDAVEISKPDSGYISNGSPGHNHMSFISQSSSTESSIHNYEYRKLYNKLMRVSKSYDFAGVCKVYTEMREKSVGITNVVLLAIYEAIIKEDPFKRFELLSQEVKKTIPAIQAIDGDDDDSPLLLLQDDDQRSLGRLAVYLMFYLLDQNESAEAFDLLHLIHDLQIHYCHCGETFDDSPNRTSCEIAMAAVKVCLRLDRPCLEGAMEVLRGSRYGLPEDSVLTQKDDENRRSILTELIEMLLKSEDYNNAYDVLDNSDNQQGWSFDPGKYFNELLLRFAEKDDAHAANKIYEFMKSKAEIANEKTPFRAYLNSLVRAGQVLAAKELFDTGRELEIYPSQDRSDPYYFELPCDLTRIEMLFMLEEHLRTIRRTVFDGDGKVLPLMGSICAFKIILKPNYELFETAKEQAEIAKENMTAVLTEMMRPPLKIMETENPEEPLVIGVTSIIGWYKYTGLLKKPSPREALDNLPVKRSVFLSDAKDPMDQPRVTIIATPTVSYDSNNIQGDEARLETEVRPGTDIWLENEAPVGEETLPGKDASVNRSEDERLRKRAITLVVNRRVLEYRNQGRVQDFEECVKMLTKVFCKTNIDKIADGSFDVETDVGAFVDKFFVEHAYFKKK